MGRWMNMARELGQLERASIQEHGSVIEPGAVVLVESKGERALAIVDFMSMEEARSNLRPGLWLCLVPADGEWFWCHESRIIDRCPACPACGRPDRWQKIEQAIVCTACLRRAT
jgi:hypothetical protein